jgi:hypothetical protein
LGLLGAALANAGTFSTPLRHVIVIESKKQNIHAQRNLGREAYLRQEVKVPLDRWALRNSNALCGIPFREAKRGL